MTQMSGSQPKNVRAVSPVPARMVSGWRTDSSGWANSPYYWTRFASQTCHSGGETSPTILIHCKGDNLK